MSKKKNELDYSKIKKEVSQAYYNHDKIFIQYISAINKCDTKSDIESFAKLAEGFKKQDAPDELVKYLETSINNKRYDLAVRHNINLGKLRAISKQY